FFSLLRRLTMLLYYFPVFEEGFGFWKILVKYTIKILKSGEILISHIHVFVLFTLSLVISSISGCFRRLTLILKIFSGIFQTYRMTADLYQFRTLKCFCSILFTVNKLLEY
ncbi:hypothetical protein L9F63_006358, partial [Diploptera punctata]